MALAGCAQAVRNKANTQLGEGHYEVAIQELQQGLDRFPESATLRGGLISARAEISTRLIAQAEQQRAAGQFDEAEKTLARALALDPQNDKLQDLQVSLGGERQAQKSLDSALDMAQDNRAQALVIVNEALKQWPRYPGLQALQRKLQTQVPSESGRASSRALAETRPITLDFRNAPLSTVLEAITQGSGVNFVLDKDVKLDNRLTLFLRSARVEDAIDLVTQAHQLARTVLDPQTVLIYPNTPEKLREHQEQVIRVFHLNNTDAKSTAALLRTLLKIKEPFVDERANFVAVRESPEVIAMAERLVALQDMGEAEVMLEVEILEVQTSRLTELGINFPNSVSLTPLPDVGATGLTVRGLRNINSDRVGVGVSNVLINLRREVGDVNVLANPRIRAKNREKAHILIGDKLPVITTNTSSTGFLSESVSYLDVGIKLDVEPLVSPDNDVSIKLGLEVSTLTKQVTTAGGSTAYQISTRNANTALRLRDGETQLLAGLISNEDRSSANRVPGLGDLPVLGRLFSSQRDDYQRKELVLAITPRILHSAPRPDLAQAQIWVGTEATPRLRTPPIAVLPSSVTAAPLAVRTDEKPTTTSVLPADPLLLTWSVPSDLKVGQEFVVTLNLSSGVPLRGAPLELAFASPSLEVLEVSEGSYFKQKGGTISFTHAVNPSTGGISAGILGNDANGVNGQGSLLQLKLRAKDAGSSQLTISSFKPIAANDLVTAPEVSELPVLQLNLTGQR